MQKIKKAAALAAGLMFLSGCAGNNGGNTEVVYNTVSEETTTTTAEETTAAELEKYIITCAEIAYKTIREYDGEIPNTMEVTDDVMLSDVLGYDMSLAEDHSVYLQMISTELFELTIIREKERCGNLINKMLEQRRDDLKEKAAYYPQQTAAAEATVIGEINGVHYLICSEKAGDIEKRVMYYVLRN
jgi:PBP1b-binding outer membrane lipoprotein LpoB